MEGDKWTRESLVKELAQIYLDGGHLSTEYLLKTAKRSDLHGAIYYKDHATGKPKYFGNITKAREAVIEYFISINNKKAAKDVKNFKAKTTALTDEEIKIRTKKFVKKLRRKIFNGEPINYRYQQDKDRTFIYEAIQLFGQYKKGFEVAKLNYEEHTKYNLPLTKEGLLKKLNSYLLAGKNPERTAMIAINKKLVDRINSRFDGYYDGLEQAKEKLIENGFPGTAAKIDKMPEIREARKRIHKKAYEQKVQEGLEKILIIDKNKTYKSEELPMEVNSQILSGRGVFLELEKSEDWIGTVELAKILKCEESNIGKNIIHKHPELVIKYTTGQGSTYFYKKELAEVYSSGMDNKRIKKYNKRTKGKPTKEEQRDKIPTINYKDIIDAEEFFYFDIAKNTTGKELHQLLEQSPQWLSFKEIGDAIMRHPNTARRLLTYTKPEKGIRIQHNSYSKYFFHKNAVPETIKLTEKSSYDKFIPLISRVKVEEDYFKKILFKKIRSHDGANENIFFNILDYRAMKNYIFNQIDFDEIKKGKKDINHFIDLKVGKLLQEKKEKELNIKNKLEEIIGEIKTNELNDILRFNFENRIRAKIF